MSICSDHPIFLINHTHKCDACGTEWGHSEKSLDCTPCHTCPSCGFHNSSSAIVYKFTSRDEEIKFLHAKIGEARRRGGLEARIIILACGMRIQQLKERKAL